VVLDPLCICLGIEISGGVKFTSPPGVELNSVLDGTEYAPLICTQSF
jgi:hypothetical protein